MGWLIGRVLFAVPPHDGTVGDHPSRDAVAGTLVRPTRELGRAALERSLSGLAPGGVYRAATVTRRAGGLLHHRFTLTTARRRWRSAFCGTVPRVTSGGCWPPPCPVEPGPSSKESPPPRSPGQPIRTHRIAVRRAGRPRHSVKRTRLVSGSASASTSWTSSPTGSGSSPLTLASIAGSRTT